MDQLTKTIEFRRPVKVGEGDAAKSYASIVVREPTAGQYEEAEHHGTSFGFDVALTALVAGVPIDVIDKAGISVPAEALRFVDQILDQAPPPPPSDEDWTMALPQALELKDQEGNVQMSFASLDLSEPTNQQRRKANAGASGYAAAIALLASVSGVSRGALRKMRASDFLRAIQYLNGFQVGRQAPEPD